MDTATLAKWHRAKERLLALYAPACHLCEIRCGVDRAGGVRGDCGLAEHTPVYRRLIHLGEELPLVPSYAVWLAGCNFLCTFCSDEPALRPPFPGKAMSAEALADAIAADLQRATVRVRNLNFVGGEPAISLPYLADVALALAERMAEVPPLLLNTNGFMTTGALDAAIDLFELFVVDFKFGNDDCADAIGTPPRYVGTLTRNLQRLARSGRQVWVRHLLMPGHLDCCTRPVLDMLGAWPELTVNVMPAFVAFDRRWSPLTREERERGRLMLRDSGIARRYWDGAPESGPYSARV